MNLQVTPISFTSSYEPNKVKRFVSSLYQAQKRVPMADIGPKKLPFFTRVKKFFKSLYYANFYKPKGNIKK